MARITVKVHPRAKRTGITGRFGESFKLDLAALPADGKANEECVRYLAEVAGVPRARVRIVSGQTATLTARANPGQSFEAKVTTTAKAISTTSRTLLTELEVDNSKNEILPYSYGELIFNNTDSTPVLTLPSNTLLFRAQGLQVAVVGSDDTIELRPVQVGRDFGQTVEISRGVTPADRVITNPSDSLVTGIKVRIQNSANLAAAK